MFVVNDDLSIYATRGDIVCLNVSATDDVSGEAYKFQPGDIVRMKIFAKKNAEDVVMQKDFPVVSPVDVVSIMLTEADTKFGGIISKPTDYWYEIELNPFSNPQTIVGYDEDGAKIFKLFPEGKDLKDEPTKPEDIPVVDADLDLTSSRPVENRAISRAMTLLKNDLETTNKRIQENKIAGKDLEEELAFQKKRVDNLLQGGTPDGSEVVDIRLDAHGITHETAGDAVRAQVKPFELVGGMMVGNGKARVYPPCHYNRAGYTADANGLTINVGGYYFFGAPIKSVTTDVYFILEECSDVSYINPVVYVGGADETPSTTTKVKHTLYRYGSLTIVHIPYDAFAAYTGDIRYHWVAIKLDNRENTVPLTVKKCVIASDAYAGIEAFNASRNDSFTFTDISNGEVVESVSGFGYGLAHDGDYNGFTFRVPDYGSRIVSTRPYKVKAGDIIRMKSDKYGHLIVSAADTDYKKYMPAGWSYGEKEIVVQADDEVFLCAEHPDFETEIPLEDVVNFDGFEIVRASLQESEGTENNVVYVSPSGRDNNTGTEKAPFKTFAKAIESGAETIYVEPGTYTEPIVSTEKREKLSIMPVWKTYTTGAAEQPPIVLDFGERLNLSHDGATGLYRQSYPVTDENTKIYQVFIGKTVAPIAEGRSVAYPVTLWKHGDTIENDIRLLPVLSLEECRNTEESFFFDGESLYVNSDDGNFVLVDGDTNVGINIRNVTNLCLESIEVKYTYTNSAVIRSCNNTTIRKCKFAYCSTGNGASLDYTNANLYNCEAYRNRNDGFNMHGFGDTNFVNCQGYCNGDDGISHHDGCSGVIIGGMWNNNGKGGISSPTHGAKVDIYNAICHNNDYGIYAYADNAEDAEKTIIVNGCAMSRNTRGIFTNYHINATNNTFAENGVNIETRGNGTVYSVPVAVVKIEDGILHVE